MTLVVGLVTVSCSATDGDPTTTTVKESSSTAEGAVGTTTTEPPAETTTTGPPVSSGASCVEGTWVLDTESFIASMQSLFAEEGFGADAITENGGTYTVTLAPDGTFSAERADWGFTVVTSEGTFRLSVNGSETGTWSADDSSMTVMITSSDVVASSQAEVDGQVIDIPEAPVTVPDAVAEDSSYTCEGDVLSVTTDEVAIVLNRG